MNPPEDDFTQLRRLLALKRYEQPPPRYFESFSREVIVRIQAGEQSRDYSLLEALSWEAPWLQRLWNALETRPLYAGGFGLAVCGLLLTGVLLSENKNATLVAAPSAPVISEQQTAQGPASEPLAEPSPAQLVVAPVAPGQPRESLFQQLQDSQKGQPILLGVPSRY